MAGPQGPAGPIGATGATGPQGPSLTGNAASSGDSGGIANFPSTICNNACGYNLLAQTPPITVSGGGSHRLLITGQFTVKETSCNANQCPATVTGEIGLNGIALADGPYSTTVRNVGDTATIAISKVIIYGDGTYPVYLFATGSWPGAEVQAIAGMVQVIQLI